MFMLPILGSNAVSLESLINIQLRSAKGDVVKVKVRPLAANDNAPEPLEIDPHDARFYQFVIESDQLQTLDDGIYYLAAGLDTREAKDMWQGWTFSKTMLVKLAAQADTPYWSESLQRTQLIGTYLLEDKQFSEAEEHAREWIARHPDSIDAWVLLGDSLFGQASYQAALYSFLTAINKFEVPYGDSPAEQPMEIIERIHAIEEISGFRPPLNPDDPIPYENTPRSDNL